jgi:uncharacterized RDD family membrane protein YckC
MEPQLATYAGFWKRFAAYLIDSIIMSAVTFLVLIPFLAMIGISAGVSSSMEDSEAAAGLIGLLIGAYLFAIFVMMIAQWLYFALMESSSRQATLGKMALGIIVTDMNGGQLGFGKATGRYFGKIVSSMIMCIGYLMVAFTEKKQALHDMMAGTLVVNK